VSLPSIAKGWGKSLADPASGPQPGSIAGDLDALADHLKLEKFHPARALPAAALSRSIMRRGARKEFAA